MATATNEPVIDKVVTFSNSDASQPSGITSLQQLANANLVQQSKYLIMMKNSDREAVYKEKQEQAAKQFSPMEVRNKEGKRKKRPGSMKKSKAIVIIQRAWRRHIDMQVFRYYRDLINFRGQGDPGLMLRCINPKEAQLLDAAAGIHVRFRLAGDKFPPNIYYKIYTHRPVVDMCSNSPKDYTQASCMLAGMRERHNKNLLLNHDDKSGWYQRIENNGWRLVSDRLLHTSRDPITWMTSRKPVYFHHVKLERKADAERKRRHRKITWMKKMYREGMLHSKETDAETNDLIDKAARGLVTTVERQGPEAIMDWEVDELLQWTTALNFDDYLEVWKETATSNTSEREVQNLRHSSPRNHAHFPPTAAGAPVDYDPYALTRDSTSIQRAVATVGGDEEVADGELLNTSQQSESNMPGDAAAEWSARNLTVDELSPLQTQPVVT